MQRLQQQAREDVLVLSCEPTIAMKWLIPRLPAFHAAHPDIQLHLVRRRAAGLRPQQRRPGAAPRRLSLGRQPAQPEDLRRGRGAGVSP
ncbi:hypothetical protein G3435_18330 [Pseudomonas sp. MAFF212428]|uniref:LysR substrate-binding domain-containing protein n=1 Tax=Pseudomonas brassicae TaxID=2708063 RepID=A0A6M0CUT7_9PSED|nr:hypothetical protein [Pseudomonas brassicae]